MVLYIVISAPVGLMIDSTELERKFISSSDTLAAVVIQTEANLSVAVGRLNLPDNGIRGKSAPCESVYKTLPDLIFYSGLSGSGELCLELISVVVVQLLTLAVSICS